MPAFMACLLALLIEPFGIETRGPGEGSQAASGLLIEPFGIETEAFRTRYGKDLAF